LYKDYTEHQIIHAIKTKNECFKLKKYKKHYIRMTPKIVKKMINYLNNYEKYNLVNLFLLYKTENFVDYLIKLKKI
jgi:hypothetical protein